MGRVVELKLTLFIMLLATLIFLPIVLFYTGWVIRILRGRVGTELGEGRDIY